VGGAVPRPATRPPREAVTAPPALPASALPERALVIVSLEGAPAALLSTALGLSAYEGAQWARRGGYHLHRAAAPKDAEAERARLSALGLQVFSLDEAAVRTAAEPEAVTGGQLEAGAARLHTAAGVVEVGAEGLLLIVKGPVTRELPPLDSLRWSRTASLEPAFRFHLHRREPSRPLEIDPSAFDFGAHRAGDSSLLEIARWVAALSTAVPVDDGFRRLSPALAPATPPAGAAARLEDALRSGPRAAAILDNAAQFRFYSAWRGAVERAARAS
jgi:hypothetical protein